MRSLCFWKGINLIPIVAVFGITACSTPSAAQQFHKELETVGSWTATAHLTGESWLNQDVPTAYAKQTLEKTQDELKKEAKTISQIASLANQSSIQNQLQQIQSTIASLATGVDQQNRLAVSQSLRELSNQEQALHSLSAQTGGT